MSEIRKNSDRTEERDGAVFGQGPKEECTPQRDPLAWEEVRTEHVIQDKWIDFRRCAFRLPDGTVFEPYYNYSRKDYVVITAVDPDGNYLCVKQYRHGIREVTTEFPAGCIESQESGNAEETVRKQGQGGIAAIEEALQAAKRELLEETGCESDEWTYLLKIPSNASLADNYAYIFSAKNCRRVGEQSLDDTEFLNVTKLSEQELEKLIAEGGFQQAIHVMAWLLAKKS